MNIYRIYLNFVASDEARTQSMTSLQVLDAVRQNTDVSDDVAGIIAECINYAGDKSTKCENFKTCHQNVSFRRLTGGCTFCRKCRLQCRNCREMYSHVNDRASTWELCGRCAADAPIWVINW